MKIIDIQKFPTSITFNTSHSIPNGIHESLFRSYHILNRVLEEIQAGTGTDTILEIVEMMRANPLDVDNDTILSNGKE